MAARYRDRKTGKFVSRATWERSKSHGGTRYVRNYFRVKPSRKQIERAIEEEEEEAEAEVEYGGAFDSP